MSQPGPPRRKARSVRQIISGTRHLLLDFDGPICSIFAETPAPAVAGQLRGILRAAGVSFPAEVESEQDPLQVFSYAAGLSPQIADLAQRELTKLETRAAATAKPTEGAADLIATAAATGRTVIIVSNNSSYAILEYLAIHRIGPVAGVVGRDESNPELMKPSPYLVRGAVSLLDAHPAECAFVGDSASDMLAGRLAGVPVIGYVNKPGKAGLLRQAGADAVTGGLDEITTALSLAPPPAVRG
jgi:beta-phosphoglucomutase-like phosphatase (HAD superfamily)